MTITSDGHLIVKQWQFNAGGKQIWKADTALQEIISMPSRTRLESLVVTGPQSANMSDAICRARLIRTGSGGIELQTFPNDCRWALGAYDATGEHFVDGDVALWDLTFRFNDGGAS